MKAIEAFAELIDTAGDPRVSLAVTLQHFRLSDATWVNLASVTTDDAGKAKLRVPFPTDDKGSAPGLRLIRADTTPAEVLSEGGRTVYAASTGVLSVEFGRIRTIDAAETTPLVPRFRAAAQSIAGIAAAAIPAAPDDFQFDDTLARLRGGITFGRGIGIGTAVSRADTDNLVAEKNAALLVAAQRENDVRDLNFKLLGERQRAETAEALARAAASPNNAELLKVQARNAELNITNAAITEKFQARERDFNIATTRQEQFRQEAERKAAQIAAFEAEKKQIVPINVLAANVQEQIAKAQAATDGTPGLMRIGTVKVRVRGKFGDGGAGITLPGNDAVMENAGGTLDEVAFDLDRAPDTGIAKVTVPDVTRLTETAARQVLASLGFRTDSISGSKTAGFVTGQAMLQAPAAGSLASRGATILVVFAS